LLKKTLDKISEVRKLLEKNNRCERMQSLIKMKGDEKEKITNAFEPSLWTSATIISGKNFSRLITQVLIHITCMRLTAYTKTKYMMRN